MGGPNYPQATYDAESDIDANGEPSHLSSQSGDPGAFERDRAAQAKQSNGKR